MFNSPLVLHSYECHLAIQQAARASLHLAVKPISAASHLAASCVRRFLLSIQRNSPMSVEIARVIEISVRDSQALDTEALCIIGGEKVSADALRVSVCRSMSPFDDCSRSFDVGHVRCHLSVVYSAKFVLQGC